MFEYSFLSRSAQTQPIASSTPNRASPNVQSTPKPERTSRSQTQKAIDVAAQRLADSEMKKAKARGYSKKYYHDKLKKDPVKLAKKNGRRRELRAKQKAAKDARALAAKLDRLPDLEDATTLTRKERIHLGRHGKKSKYSFYNSLPKCFF